MPSEPSRRPAHLVPPPLPPSPPVPEPQAVAPPVEDPDGGPPRTRYGDWERAGIAVDF